jgi:hypothetical protein
MPRILEIVDFDTFAELSRTFAGPLIAAGGAFVWAAALQVSTNRRKSELFDRRFAVYNTIGDALAAAWNTGVITLEQSRTFLAGMRQAELLFADKSIDAFLKEMRDEVMQLLVLENLEAELSRRRSIIHTRIHPNGRLRDYDLCVVADADFPWMMPMAVVWNRHETWRELTAKYLKYHPR